MRRPRSGRLPFLGFGFEETDLVVVVACAAWKSGKPGFGFPLFHPAHAGAVGMWESRGVGEISKGRWEVWETGFWVSHTFHRPGISTALVWLHRKRGGIGDSLLHRRRSLALAAFIFSAHSVSLIASAHASICWKVIPGLRY